MFDALADHEPRVIAAAGGVVLDPSESRTRLVDVGRRCGVAHRRSGAAGAAHRRPRSSSLARRRSDWHTDSRWTTNAESCTARWPTRVVDVDRLTPDAGADRILRMSTCASRSRSRAARTTWWWVTERSANSRSLIPATARRAAVVTQAECRSTSTSSIPHVTFHIGHGEQHKSLATIGDLCRGFARNGLTRNDVVIAVGGGMVTDVAGFAAASYHRGMPVVHVATTLLGMVDAAIGGKTGVNLPEGKNLVGAFWQPSGVICDLDALDTLSPRELRCGLRRDGQVPLPHRRRPAGNDPHRSRRPVRRDQGRDRRLRRARRAGAGRCSTTATRWRMRSRRPPSTARPRRGGGGRA